jgi:hypothetical protein
VRYRVTYRLDLDLAPALVEADEVAVEGTAIVLRRTVLVIGQPRLVVARRLRASDVTAVDEAD